MLWGTVALVVGYIGLNALYKTWSAALFPIDPEKVALISSGQRLVEACTACHYLDQRANFVGPQLVGIFGRPVADIRTDEYSEALKRVGGNWTAERLSAFLKEPQTYAPGTKMAVNGWSDDEVQAIVAYLQSKE